MSDTLTTFWITLLSTLSGGVVTVATTAFNNRYQMRSARFAAENDFNKQQAAHAHEIDRLNQVNADARDVEKERRRRDRHDALGEARRVACYEYLKDLDTFRECARALEEDTDATAEDAYEKLKENAQEAWTTLASSTSQLQVLGPKALSDAVNELQRTAG
ncbi:hypothetical protein [Actinoplanes subglobosus]|uniref:Uncharacterized protein n=1 Tax=Actinoplanes subglobosus TaxID=1547892 RepID=A0ABV8IJW8_9ACTN